MEHSVLNLFKQGTVSDQSNQQPISELIWNEHPVFKGVFLKHLITGSQTNNQLSSHLVKINPGSQIGTHNHIGKTEIHEVVEGSGFCTVEESEHKYIPGTVVIIPADLDHQVTADENGLVIMAKFFPALL